MAGLDFGRGDSGRDAGDIDQDVDSAEVAMNLLDRRMHGRLVGHVAAVGDGATAQRHDLADGVAAALAVEVDHRHIGPVCGQPDGGRPAKSPRPARNHADLPGQVE